MNNSHKAAYQFFFEQAKTAWTKTGKQQQAMIALAMHRSKVFSVSGAIIKSLAENSISNDEFGMYWKEFNSPSYYWWQAPIESHALLLEAFAEIAPDTKRLDDLKTWLLKQKQTTSWESTKATAEACYALLMTGSKWLDADQTVSIKAGKYDFSASQAEAGTGYFSGTLTGEKVRPEMGNIAVQLKSSDREIASNLPSWGAVYWKYFEDLDRITPAATPLNLEKSIYLQTMTDEGIKLVPVNAETNLKPGDKLTIRLRIQSDRQLEYVHLKDMRAACLEPNDQLSHYQWLGGLGYYQAPKDASMHFFINYLPKGTYVLEYSVTVTHAGNFSNGISTIQCMYAPAFGSHTAGTRIEVKNTAAQVSQ